MHNSAGEALFWGIGLMWRYKINGALLFQRIIIRLVSFKQLFESFITMQRLEIIPLDPVQIIRFIHTAVEGSCVNHVKDRRAYRGAG